jgi:hypothetical protein
MGAPIGPGCASSSGVHGHEGKPAFEEDGLEFFVCSDGAGHGGVWKMVDPAKIVWVAEFDLALNLNIQVATVSSPRRG